MISDRVIGLLLCLAGACSSIQALDPVSAGSSAFELKAIDQSNRVAVTFASAADKKYQLFFSKDLLAWERWGEAVNGTGNRLTIEYDRTRALTGFFKVVAENLVIPVPLKVSGSRNRVIELSFTSASDKKYQVYYTFDFLRWAVFSDIIEGDGQRIALEYDVSEPAALFFKAETIQITPVANMVRIPAGAFLMGSPLTEKDRDLDEDPLTQVELALNFWMGKFEVTQGEYEALMGDNPSRFKGDPKLPVEQVAWKEAVAYCTRLTELEQNAGRLPKGYTYRLPTEAEFEYACRARTTTRFSFGDDPDYTLIDQYAWYSNNSGSKTHPVGQKKPNAFGLYDMHGNVWEWCWDWYDSRYAGVTVTNPSGPATGGSRIFRGGGWDYVASSCRSAFRNNVGPTRQTEYLGFRVVLSAIQP